jgi:hypothetical protein
MMPYLLIATILLFSNPAFAQNDQSQPQGQSSSVMLTYVRSEFKKAQSSKQATGILLGYIETRVAERWQEYPPAVYAYYAALKGLQAKFAINPFKKLHFLKLSLKLFNQAVEHAPEDLEVRFLRYASYSRYPKIDGVSERKADDLAVILHLLSKRVYSECTADLIIQMIDYLTEHAKIGMGERQSLSEIKAELANR